MKWTSTRRAAPVVSFRVALLEGLAPDGGLYLPEPLDPIAPKSIRDLHSAPLVAIGVAIAGHLIGQDIPSSALEPLLEDALNFPIPLVRLTDEVFALELFHGPTLAFKDVGARVMARLMAYFVDTSEPLTVLVATSGDTGSAVAQAFAGVAGTRVIVLFPEGQVSDVQEAQFATVGGNVQAVAVAGTFDDCQVLVKQAFADEKLRAAVRLTSANSINVGRLLPQVFYYAWAALQGSSGSKGSEGSRGSTGSEGSKGSGQSGGSLFSVPSGNFGNLTAGLLAKRLGFPIAGFVAATNVNDVVPKYLISGRYEPRASVRTIANAMDVGAPSNFERIQALYRGEIGNLRDDVEGASFSDATVKAAIRDVHSRHGYLLDPHTAIAWLGLDGRDGIFLATAHPARFRETVEPAIGETVSLPPALADALARRRCLHHISPLYANLQEVLR
jgi:threonine synthase